MTSPQAVETSLAEAQAIAKEAYIYAYPMLDSYRIQYAYFVDKNNAEYKAPWNQIKNIPRVYTPEDKAIQTPNSDTPYSMAGLDLRAEPVVLTMPVIEKDRYFSVQLIDLYTHNFDYLGSRTTGNGGGNYLIAGPGFDGKTPDGIDKVIKSETELVIAAYRTQLFNTDDLENVKEVQSGYKIQTLSQFEGKSAPKTVPAIDFIKPLSLDLESTSSEVFNILNFVLQFCPINSTEVALMERFSRIGIGAGQSFDKTKLAPELVEALEKGIVDAWQALAELKKNKIDKGEVTSGDLFGTREFLKNNYLYRMAAAKLGIYGNSKQEAMYPIYSIDADGNLLDGSKGSYLLRFAADSLPPVNAFWSLTMYELPSSLLIENPIKRYLINSPMLDKLKRDQDGGLTLYLQRVSPGNELTANWLPAPDGPFMAVLRLYWPKESAVNGEWKQPPLKLSN